MTAVPKDAVPRHDGAVQATSGEFAGWWTWTRDHYEVHNGPFWHREENGKVRCVFRVEQKHINGGGAVTRFTVPEKLNTGRPSAVSMPRMKMIERPARTTSPLPSTSSPW